MTAIPNTALPTTVEQVCEQLDNLNKMKPTTQEWSAFWMPLLFNANVGPVGVGKVLEHLVTLGVGGKRPLGYEWKEFCAGQKATLREHQGLERRAQSGKTVIDVGQGEEHVVTSIEAALVSAKDPELPLLRDLNGYVRPVVDRPDWGSARSGQIVPTVAMLAQHTESSLRWGIGRHIELEEGGCVVLCDPWATNLLQNPLPTAPLVRGLITHPLVCADGRLIDEPGLDVASGLYLHLGGKLGEAPPFVAPPIAVPADAVAAHALALKYLVEMLRLYDDYRFESPLDMAVALSARMTILTRKDLDIAPAFLLAGPERNTGKTTLAAIDHVIATGHDIPAASLEEDSDKAKQTLFACFASSPAGVLIDNLPASDSYGSDVLAQVLTKSTIETRQFHAQRNIRANTNTQMYLTGTAVVLNEDLQTRTLEVRFSSERPAKWSHPDWLGYARSIREDVRVKLQYIQRAYIQHGLGKVAGVKTRFASWSQRVRDPLLWAGLPDVGKRFQELEDSNPLRVADAGIVGELFARYGLNKFTAGDVASKLDDSIAMGDSRPRHPEFASMRAMIQERCPKALGKSGAQYLGGFFREYLKRWLLASDGVRLRLDDTAEKGMTRWRVEQHE